LIKSLTMIFSV